MHVTSAATRPISPSSDLFAERIDAIVGGVAGRRDRAARPRLQGRHRRHPVRPRPSALAGGCWRTAQTSTPTTRPPPAEPLARCRTSIIATTREDALDRRRRRRSSRPSGRSSQRLDWASASRPDGDAAGHRRTAPARSGRDARAWLPLRACRVPDERGTTSSFRPDAAPDRPASRPIEERRPTGRDWTTHDGRVHDGHDARTGRPDRRRSRSIQGTPPTSDGAAVADLGRPSTASSASWRGAGPERESAAMGRANASDPARSARTRRPALSAIGAAATGGMSWLRPGRDAAADRRSAAPAPTVRRRVHDRTPAASSASLAGG